MHRSRWISWHGSVVRGLPDFTDLVEQVGPAVVNIRTVERVRRGRAKRLDGR
jgi:serine protease Do